MLAVKFSRSLLDSTPDRMKLSNTYRAYETFTVVCLSYADATYADEYEFGFDLYRAFQNTHDGHFDITPDSVGFIFNFFRTTPLISVSEDGEKEPEVYAFSDVLECTAGNGTYTPNPVTHIDGRDSQEFLLEWFQYGIAQDRDALWNNMF